MEDVVEEFNKCNQTKGVGEVLLKIQRSKGSNDHVKPNSK